MFNCKSIVRVLAKHENINLRSAFVDILRHAISRNKKQPKVVPETPEPAITNKVKLFLQSEELVKTKKRLSVFLDDELNESTPSHDAMHERDVSTTPFNYQLDLAPLHELSNYQTPSFKQSIHNKELAIRSLEFNEKRLKTIAFRCLRENVSGSRELKTITFKALKQHLYSRRVQMFKAEHFHRFCLYRKCLEVLRDRAQKIQRYRNGRNSLLLRKVLYQWASQVKF